MSVLAIVLQVVAWSSFGLAAAAFLGYPAFTAVAARVHSGRRSADAEGDKQPRPWEAGRLKPKVAVIVAVHNEERSIAATLDSLLEQDYPAERRRIIVFSDGSTDKTADVVRSFKSRGVELVEFGRLGKTECQNRVVESLSPDVEIAAFADGNVRWEPQSLSALVAPLRDNVAATTGKLMLESGGSEEREHEGLFRRFDEAVKAGEDALGSTVGVNGPIYAVRRREYIRLRADLVSDLVLPVLLVARGRRVAYVPESIAREPASPNIWTELRRKRRLVTQGLVALPLLLRAGWRSRTPGLLSMLTFHKILRWFGLELLVLSFIASVLLLPHPVYAAAVTVGLLALAGAFVAIARAAAGRSAGPLMPLGYFLLTTFGGVLGKFDLLRGERQATWRTTRSATPEATPTPSTHALSIVVVTYQSRNDIAACLKSLEEHPSAQPHEVIVVDNASADGTADFVAREFPRVQLIRNSSNEGFGRANNRAIAKARGRYIFCLNPDASVTAGALDTLLAKADTVPLLGTLAPKLQFPGGRLQPNSYWFPTVGVGLVQLAFGEKLLEHAAARQPLTTVDWSFGAALLFPRLIDGTLTLFDPEIFLYSEDIELCWRLRTQGRTNVATADATIVHALNRSGAQLFGEGGAGEARFAEWKKTLRYVTRKHWRGPLKGARFWLYCQLRAIAALERALVLPLRRLPAPQREQLAHEHLAKARVFTRA